MDEQTSTNAASAALDLYALAGEEGRRRAQDFLTAQQSQLERLESELLGHLETLGSELSAFTSASTGEATDEALEAQRASLREQLERVRLKSIELNEREAALQNHQEQLDRAEQARVQREKLEQENLQRREGELASAESSLRQAQRTLQVAHDELNAEREQLSAERRRLQDRQAQLDLDSEKCEAEQQRIKSQRRHVAQELKAQKTAQLAAVEKERLVLERLRTEIEVATQDLATREQQFEESEARVRQLTKDLAAEQQELQHERDQVVQLRKRLEEQRGALDAEHDKLAERQAELTQQGRRIAQKLKTQHAANQQEIERKRRELETIAQTRPADVDARLLTATAECQALRDELDQVRKALTDRAGEAARSREQLTTMNVEVDTLRREHDRLSQELAVRETAVAAERARLESLQAERNALSEQLAAALAAKPSKAQREEDDEREERSSRDEDLQRRYEMSIEELRGLKRSNAELEEKLQKAKAGKSVADSSPGGGKLDWEAQKRRILQSLEDDFDEKDEEEAEEKISIEEVIRKTDELIAQKDLEIAELKQLLNEQSSNLGDVAVGAAAIAQAFDQDELILQERERLQQMQQECEAKLRKAEIDISLERAKIARERAEIDEKFQQLARQKTEMGLTDDHPATPGQPQKPTRGRWLTRLGLKEEDQR